MQQSSSFELSWSNLIDLWNESSYEKGADLSFKEIVILESFAEEGVEPCQGFDWLPVAKLAEPVKPKKRTISYSFGKYTAHVAQAPKASLETLNLLMSRPMNMLALGEISARQLGLPLWFWRNVLVAATGWMVGVSVALAGAIGFIGLVIPHILRLCGLTDHRVLLPGCALAGASALLLADIVARLALAAAELPIGVVTATLGAPVFIWLLLKARR